MIIVDKQKYGKYEWQTRSNQMARTEPYRNPLGRRYGVCLKHPFDLLSTIFYLREHGGSVLLIHADTPVDTARQTAEEAGCSYLLYDAWDEWTAIPTGPCPDNYESSVLQYSSGTTGKAKLIARPWTQVDLEIESYNKLFQPGPDEQPLILVPLSHSFGLITGVLASLARGREPEVVHNKNPKYALHQIRSVNKPIVYGVPFQFHLLDSLAKDEAAIHKLVSSGSPLSEPLLNRLRKNTEEIWQQYGCTETGCLSLGSGPSSPSDVGFPLSHYQLSILSENSEPACGNLAATAGEIAVEVGAGIIRTRDLGYRDPVTGRLHVLGRFDDLINVSGLKVIPSEVEAVIGRMPGIAEVVVFKTEHSVWGEAVKAMVVASSAVQEQDIRSWCMEHLPAYQVPGTIERVAEIPKMPSGKISRTLLQKRERTNYGK